MFPRLSLALLMAGFVAMMCPAASGQDAPPVLEYLSARAAQQAAQLPPLPETPEAWEKHRAELTKKLTAVLGLPDRRPMQAAVTHSRQQGELTIEEVAYLWAERAYVSATVLRGTKAAARQPALVVTPGWLGHYTFRPYRQFVEALARRGVLVLFIDDPRTGQRHAPPAGLYAAASAAGLQVAGIQVFDALRALEYLLTRPDVDPGKIGIAGLGEGALQAYLAAALEPRFQFVIAVGGTTTYEALLQAAARGSGPEDPSAYVAGLLGFTDLDRVAACVAPRPLLVAGGGKGGRWPVAGHRQGLRTLKAVYGLASAPDRLRPVSGESPDDLTPYTDEIARWLESSVWPSLPGSSAAPAACGPPTEPDFSVLSYLQRQVAAQAAALAGDPATPADWQARRRELVEWLRTACSLASLKPTADKVLKVTEGEALVTEDLALSLDAGWSCPAVLVRPAQPGAAKCGAVILSHDDRQYAGSARIAEAARQLAGAGYWVLVPEHASAEPQSRQTLAPAAGGSFYGDDAARLCGPADAVGLPPLALRVAEDLAAFRHLAARGEVDPARITIAGLGMGAVDAALAAAVEDRLAGAACIGATTMRDWVANVAAEELRFVHPAPYLPGLLTRTDWDGVCAAVAPRPLVLATLKDGWPRSGGEQLAARATALYKLLAAEAALVTLGPRAVPEELAASQPDGVPKQLLTAARLLLPAPPQAGLVGNLDGLKSRQTVDSASGLIWLVAELDGYEQGFTGPGYELQTWSFYNNNGAAQKDRVATPLLFQKQGAGFQLIGIGTPRTNAGTGVQTFAFEPIAGTAVIGEDCFFGWYDGHAEGVPNAGVVEFEDAPDARMTILTADGQLGGQKLAAGATYREQSEYRRRYSIMATAKKK